MTKLQPEVLKQMNGQIQVEPGQPVVAQLAFSRRCDLCGARAYHAIPRIRRRREALTD